MFVLRNVLFSLRATFAPTIMVLCLLIDVQVFGSNISDMSLTEIMQGTVLVVIVFIHFLVAKIYKSQRYCNIILGGFFLVMLIRELDAVFDITVHGCWIWLTLFSTLCVLIYPAMHFFQTATQLVQYTRFPYYGMMLSGLLTILVFSRLFGMSCLWMIIHEGEYTRVVKNIVEEGCELFGYLLCLSASSSYYCFLGLTEKITFC